MNNYEAKFLKEIIGKELISIPIENWGFFYPCQVAVWRYIQNRRPGVLDEINTGYDSEPYFKGKGSKWFCEKLFNDNDYLDIIEEIMYFVVDNLNPKIKERGFLLKTELPNIDLNVTEKLSKIVLEKVDDAVQKGTLNIDV